MRTISQVAELTGISIRTLQYYDVIKHWGNIENFNMFIQKIKDDEAEIVKLAIQQFGSIEKYTEAMKHNLEHFSELMETQLTEEVKEIGKQSDILYGRLTADLSEDVSSPKIQSIVHELLRLIQENSTSVSLDKPYINVLIDTYSSDYIKSMTDSKYGEGASDLYRKSVTLLLGEYNATAEGKIYLFTGSKVTGGFCVTRKGLLEPSKLGYILTDNPALQNYQTAKGEFIKYIGRISRFI